MVSGIPEIEAKRYEEKLKKGNYLIAAHTDESEDVDRAKGRFGIDAMLHEKWSCDDGAKTNSQWPPVLSDANEASTCCDLYAREEPYSRSVRTGTVELKAFLRGPSTEPRYRRVDSTVVVF